MRADSVDVEELVDRLGGDREAAAEIIEIFSEDAPALVSEIRDAADDLTRLRRAAHTLKGASGNIGAHAACQIAGLLQHAAASGDAVQAGGARLALLQEMGRVFADLARARASLAAELAP